MITVEDANDVAAFKDYVHKEEAVAAVAADDNPSPPEVKPVAPLAPPKVQTLPSTPAPVAPVVATAVTPIVSTPTPVVSSVTSSSYSTAWGLSVTKTSPLAKSLAAQQAAYIKLYGTTGQAPIL
jgi:hypothetical protein